MPFDRTKYPENWESLSHSIRFVRADGACEWPGCGARHGATIYRRLDDPEVFASVPPDVEPEFWRPVKVVLTTAHLCRCDPPCGRPGHLQALCQLHHLRLDARQHAETARRTRRRRSGQLDLFDA